MDCTRNTILHFCIQFWKCIPIINTSFLNIPHSSLLNNIPHKKPLNGLILGAAFAAIGTANEVNVPATVLVATAIPALESHFSATLAVNLILRGFSFDLLLYKWTPITPNSSDANAADNQQQPPPPSHRKFRYVPVSLIEEKEEAKEDEETNPNADQSPVENNSGDAIEGKPDTYDVPMEDSQASDQDRPAMHEPREGNLDLNLGWKAHNRDNIADHIMLDQNMGWTG